MTSKFTRGDDAGSTTATELSQKDRERFDAFVRALRGPMLRIAQNLCRNTSRDPEDLVQEALERALRQLAIGGGSDPLTLSFVSTVMMNRHIDLSRRRRAEEGSMVVSVLPEPSGEPSFPRPEEVERWRGVSDERLLEAMSALRPQRIREAYRLQARGLRYKQIAERLGVLEGTVGSDISEARRQLRKLLASEDDSLVMSRRSWPGRVEQSVGDSCGVITFYSSERGDGRSMAAANVAMLLAKRGHQVLVVDCDLETPGIGKFLLDESWTSSYRWARTPGMVDLLHSFAESSQLHWRDCVLSAQPSSSDRSKIDILPAGRREEDIGQGGHVLDFELLFARHDLGRKIEVMRSEWLATYDTVLIDSRAGMSDIGAICSIHLPDVLVAFFIPDGHSISETKYVLRRAAEEHARLPVDRRALITVPVLAHGRALAGRTVSEAWFRRAAQELGMFCDDWRPKRVRPVDVLRFFNIPYESRRASGRGMPVIVEGGRSIASDELYQAYEKLAALLESEMPASIQGEREDVIQDILSVVHDSADPLWCYGA